MAITVIGNLDSVTGTALTTLTVTSTVAVGDCRVLFVKIGNGLDSVASVSGGNCAASGGAAGSWARVAGPTVDTNATAHTHEIWLGTVSNTNSTGKETITLTYSLSIVGIGTDLDARAFSSGLGSGTTWAKDGSQSGFNNNASSASITYPSLTAAGSGELYVGHSRTPSGGSYGTPAGGGFTWVTTTDANGNPYIYSLSTGSGTVAPTQSTSASTSFAIGVLITASGATTHALAADGLASSSGTASIGLPPVVTGISPTSGPQAGGTAVTVSGRNLWDATAVKFAAASATSVVAGAIATITAVGSLISAVAAQQTTLSVSPAAAGNILMLAVETKFTVGQNYSCTGVSGGGCTQWTRAVQLLPDAQGIHEITIWYGVVTTPGAATITATFSNAGTVSTELACQEFHPSTGANTAWVADVVGTISSAASTTPPYPPLTPTSTGELYFGFIQWPGSGSGGGTTGFIYQTDANGNQVAYNLNVSGTVSPVASSASQVSSAGAVLMRAVDSRVTCVSPAGTGTVDVTVITPPGTSATSAADLFTYTTLPLAADGKASSSGTATFVLTEPLVADGKASSSGTAALVLKLALAADGKASSSGSIAFTVLLVADGKASSSGSASFGLSLPLTAAGKASSSGTALLVTGKIQDPFAVVAPKPKSPLLGCGIWRVFVATRGGSQLLAELAFETLTLSRKLSDTSDCSVVVSGDVSAECAPVLASLEPFKHEIVAFRNWQSRDVPAWAGPVTVPVWGPYDLTIGARDLFAWFDRRHLPFARNFLATDLGSIFGQYMADALVQDPSPMISLMFRGEIGIVGARSNSAVGSTIAGDALRELSRSGVNFSAIGRTIYWAGVTDNTATVTLYDGAILQDAGGGSPKLTKQGLNMATQVIVNGATLGFGVQVQSTVGFPDSDHGLITLVVSEPLIQDALSATKAGAGRLGFLNPAPHYLTLVLSPQAPVAFEQLIPGIRLDAAFRLGVLDVMDSYRLHQVDVSVDSKGDEKVALTLVPLVV